MIQRQCFWAALLIHFLLLFGTSVYWVTQMQPQPRPSLTIPSAVPSYVYKQPNVPSTTVKSQLPSPTSNDAELPKQSVLPPSQQESVANNQPVSTHSTAVRKVKEFNVMDLASKEDPVHLIGDKDVNVPLLTLLGKALTAKLIYPKIAVDFRVRGLVLVGFTIHPDGHITNEQLVRSSGAGVLDEEAMRALHAIAPVPNVAEYVTEPKFMVVGILFGYQA